MAQTTASNMIFIKVRCAGFGGRLQPNECPFFHPPFWASVEKHGGATQQSL